MDNSIERAHRARRGKLFWFVAVIISVSLIAITLLAGYVRGWSAAREEFHQTIAMSWGEGTQNFSNGSLWYGARVIAIPNGSSLDIHFRIWIDQPIDSMEYMHDSGKIGTAKDFEDAVANWGTISWTPTTVDVGSSTTVNYSLTRAKLQAHR